MSLRVRHGVARDYLKPQRGKIRGNAAENLDSVPFPGLVVIGADRQVASEATCAEIQRNLALRLRVAVGFGRAGPYLPDFKRNM
jgi:hypothetical protein